MKVVERLQFDEVASTPVLGTVGYADSCVLQYYCRNTNTPGQRMSSQPAQHSQLKAAPNMRPRVGLRAVQQNGMGFQQIGQLKIETTMLQLRDRAFSKEPVRWLWFTAARRHCGMAPRTSGHPERVNCWSRYGASSIIESHCLLPMSQTNTVGTGRAGEQSFSDEVTERPSSRREYRSRSRVTRILPERQLRQQGSTCRDPANGAAATAPFRRGVDRLAASSTSNKQPVGN